MIISRSSMIANDTGRDVQHRVTKAVLPCAGNSHRLKGILQFRTKLLLPLQGRPLVSYVIEELKILGITNIVCVVSDHEEELQHVIGDGSFFSLCCDYLFHSLHDGPGGAILAAEEWIGEEPFVVALPDTLNFASRSSLLTLSHFARACSDVSSEQAEIAFCCKGNTSVRVREAKVSVSPIGRWAFTPFFLKILRATTPGGDGEIRVPTAVELADDSGLVVHCFSIGSDWHSVNINTPHDYRRAALLMECGYAPTLM